MLNEVARMVVGVLVVFAVAHVAHEACYGVAQMQGDWLTGSLPHAM